MSASRLRAFVVFLCLMITGCKISGRVVDDNNRPMEGVTVVLGGADSKTVKTLSDGSFVFERVKAGVYTVAPIFQNYTFQPAGLSVVKGDGDVSDLIFLGTYQPPVAAVTSYIEQLVASRLAVEAFYPYSCEGSNEAGMPVTVCASDLPKEFTSDFSILTGDDAGDSGIPLIRTRIMEKEGDKDDMPLWAMEILKNQEGLLSVRLNGNEYVTDVSVCGGDIIKQQLSYRAAAFDVTIFRGDSEIFRQRMAGMEDIPENAHMTHSLSHNVVHVGGAVTP